MMTDSFLPADAAPWTDVAPGVRRQILVHDDAVMMLRVAFQPGAVGEPHFHPHIQASYVEAGGFDVTIAGRTERLTVGGSFIVPPNAVHGVVALETGGVLVDVFTPRRDDFLAG